MSTAAGHACDACRRRKIRCDRNQPCACCANASLSCTFLAPTRAKGRQGRTANVISQLRSSQIQNIQGSISQSRGVFHSQDAQGSRRTHGLLTQDTFDACCEFYFAQFHTGVPIVKRELLKFESEIEELPSELYCLVVTFSAFIILQTGAVHPTKSTAEGGRLLDDIGYGQSLIREALESRSNSKAVIRPSIQSVTTSFLLYACYRFLNDESKAWYFLREATTLYISGTLDENKTTDLEGIASEPQLFWLLLVTERAYALRRHRPLTLLVSPSSPSISGLPQELQTSGFTYLVKLYQPFDEIFLGSWNHTSSATSIASVLALETHLQQTISVGMKMSEIQLADLLVSQQWLRLIVWQLAMKLGYLSSSSKHESLSFRYPVNIARDLMISTWPIAVHSMEIHGLGLVEKLFDICYQLIDVMAYTTSTLEPQLQPEVGPDDYVSYLFSLITTLRGSEDRFLPVLQAKLEQTLPWLVDSIAKTPRNTEMLSMEDSPRSEDESVML